MAYMGIDVGGHAIKAGVISKKGNIIHKEVVLTEADKGRETVVDNIVRVGLDLMKMEKISGIGVGVPGVVDKDGHVTLTPNIPLSGYDLGSELKSHFKKKVAFGNDADNFAIAQHHFGPGKNLNNIITLTLGTGVGSGIILDGKLFSNKGAPEFGHTTIKFDAPCDDCINDGSVEMFLGRKSFKGTTPLDVYKKATQNDKKALKIFEKYGMYLGVAIANISNIFNPDIVILGGQLSNAYDFFKVTMEKEIEKRTLFKTKVVRNQLREAGMIGAAILSF